MRRLLEILALLFFGRGLQLSEGWSGGRAKAVIQHRRPSRWLADGSPDPASYQLLSEEEGHNVVTTSGRDFLHAQGYGVAPAGNGLNYIGLSNDALTETSASTTLSNEIAGNGLGRAAGTPAHTNGTAITTVTKVFTATGAQAAQKAALFTAGAAGVMCHALAFTPRSLVTDDTLTVTFEISLGA